MRRQLRLSLLLSTALILPMACSSSTTQGPDGGKAGKDGGAGTGGGGTAGADAAAGTGGTIDAPMDVPQDGGDGGLTGPALRGSYLVNSVLGCSGCHTPQKVGGGGPDTTKLFSGVECFAKDTGGGCLNSANLTSDATGIKNLTDQQVKDAFTTGVFPAAAADAGAADAGTQYLFANMPYYQFANLSSDDATAIVAYLRTLTAVAHMAPANTGTFATRPTSAQWTPVTLAALPSPAAAATDGGADGGGDAAATEAGTDAGSASVSNGKYLAALVCSTCHTVNTSATAPLQLDATKAYQGGKGFTTTVPIAADGGTDGGADGGTDAGADGGDAGPTTMSKMIQSANLTPDMTGLKDWTPAQIVTAIKMAKDEAGRTICSPMRSLPNITDQDAMDIANYLKAIPAVANAITLTCE